MSTNLEKYKKDLEKLIVKGDLLEMAMVHAYWPDRFEDICGKKRKEIKNLPIFAREYQNWYSEAKTVIKQLLPDRLDDLVRYYEKPKGRKTLNPENYRIEDCLQGLEIARRNVGPHAAISLFQQQLAILKSVSARFESSLFDIKSIVQADLFDSELKAALELIQNGYLRPAGAVAGVVLEKHLAQVTSNHNLKIRKKNPTISDFNVLLKDEGVLDVPSWRRIQHLGDIRNQCVHHKDKEPTKEDVEELVSGVEKFTKTLF